MFGWKTKRERVDELARVIRWNLGDVRLAKHGWLTINAIGSQKHMDLMEAVKRINKELEDGEAEFRLALVPFQTTVSFNGNDAYGTRFEVFRRIE